MTKRTMFDERIDYLGNGKRFTSHSLSAFWRMVILRNVMHDSQTNPSHPRSDHTRGLIDSSTRVLVLWNWKSAILSAMLRVPVFAVGAALRGLEAAVAATLAETVVCAFNAGCYAAVVQVLRNKKPVWLTAFLITVGLPAAGQLLEYEVHAWRETPHRTIAVIISSVLSAVSALFNWYAMKHGTLLVGGEGDSLSEDLRRIPSLLGRFLLMGPRWLLRRLGWIALPSN